jgi:hypothetical protein
VKWIYTGDAQRRRYVTDHNIHSDFFFFFFFGESFDVAAAAAFSAFLAAFLASLLALRSSSVSSWKSQNQ